MKIYQAWQSDYENNRYLSHLSLTELTDRLKYLIENISTLGLDGKFGCVSNAEKLGRNWWIKFTHTQHEFDLRGLKPLNNFLAESTIPEALIEKSERLKELNRIVTEKNPDLIKFGAREHLESLSFKVSLASSFKDYSLNQSQFDNELEAVFNPNPNSFFITDHKGKKHNPVGPISITFSTDIDHYIYCTTTNFDVRLFGNFDSDACLLIYDRDKFSELLSLALRKQIRVKRMEYGLVEYFDPITNDHGKEPTVHFHKHLKYAYQKEHRHVFFHDTNEYSPQHIFVELPEVKEISEVICI